MFSTEIYSFGISVCVGCLYYVCIIEPNLFGGILGIILCVSFLECAQVLGLLWSKDIYYKFMTEGILQFDAYPKVELPCCSYGVPMILFVVLIIFSFLIAMKMPPICVHPIQVPKRCLWFQNQYPIPKIGLIINTLYFSGQNQYLVLV